MTGASQSEIDNMRILMTVTFTSLMDGVCRHILAVAPALNAEPGVEVAVLTTLPPGDLNRALAAQGVRTFSLMAPNGHTLAIWWRFARIMREFKPDIVHSHVLPWMVAVALKYRYPSIPYMMTEHGTYVGNRTWTWRQRLAIWAARFSRVPKRAICYVSRGSYESYPCRPAKAILEVAYNPMRFAPVLPPRPAALHALLRIDPAAPIVGTACRIAAVKNPRALTEVMCRALRRVPAAHAVLIGEGSREMMAEVDEVLARQDETVRARFHLPGYRADAAELVRDLDVFIMTSSGEGLPTALLEAIAGGVPIAFWNGDGGLKDIARLNEELPGCVEVREQGDVEGLAEGVVKILQAPPLARSHARGAFEIARKRFSVEATTAKLIDVYRRVLSAEA